MGFISYTFCKELTNPYTNPVIEFECEENGEACTLI